MGCFYGYQPSQYAIIKYHKDSKFENLIIVYMEEEKWLCVIYVKKAIKYCERNVN